MSSIGRLVALEAIRALGPKRIGKLGIEGRERAVFTFVETACLLHDIGNPPFGHFGELAISTWFHTHAHHLAPDDIGPNTTTWDKNFVDFQHFDGNPQGFRIVTRLQPRSKGDLDSLNLTATTLAATLKYPWTSDQLAESKRKKAGYFHTETDVVEWIRKTLGIAKDQRHPLVYLMEAADDIAYCVSDIEDGIEKGLIQGRQFARFLLQRLTKSPFFRQRNNPNINSKDRADRDKILEALRFLKEQSDSHSTLPQNRLTPLQDLRSAAIRILARCAGKVFADNQSKILEGDAKSLLSEAESSVIKDALGEFASEVLYSSKIVRNREITAQAVLSGLLDAYNEVMKCSSRRFDKILEGARRDGDGKYIARDSSLMSHVARKHLAVYFAAVERAKTNDPDPEQVKIWEKVLRIRLIVDHITGMTDEFALQFFQLISGVQINPFRNS